jgi:hypothetical protein
VRARESWARGAGLGSVESVVGGSLGPVPFTGGPHCSSELGPVNFQLNFPIFSLFSKRFQTFKLENDKALSSCSPKISKLGMGV